jgi:hypothetical protein
VVRGGGETTNGGERRRWNGEGGEEGKRGRRGRREEREERERERRKEKRRGEEKVEEGREGEEGRRGEEKYFESESSRIFGKPAISHIFFRTPKTFVK